MLKILAIRGLFMNLSFEIEAKKNVNEELKIIRDTYPEE
jgi:hypothetical protein